MRVERVGVQRAWGRDVYHYLLTIRWSGLLGLLSLAYVLFNAGFALLDLAGGDCLAGAGSGSFLDAFFFSVQTVATIGYGTMSPSTVYADTLVAAESLLGILGIAVATGLMFSKFSRPTARVLFSDVAVVTRFDGVPTLMFRMANERGNQIVEATVRAFLVRDERNAEGVAMRRFRDLALARSQSPVFAVSWTAMHPIDEHSPLHGHDGESPAACNAEIVVSLSGIDETLSQTVHVRNSYIPGELRWGARFADVMTRRPDGVLVLDYTRFHDVLPDGPA